MIRVGGDEIAQLPREKSVDGFAVAFGEARARICERGENVPSLILKVSLALEISPGDLLSDFSVSKMKKLRLNE